MAATFLAACGGGSGGNGSHGDEGGGACGEAARKEWLLDVAQDWYLFPETLPASVNLGSYATAEELLDALTATARAQGRDRFFSYLTTRAAEDSLFGEGEFVGFGFRNRVDDGNRPMIIDVYHGSPASEAGLARGDEVLQVDGTAIGDENLSDLLGPAEDGVRRVLTLRRLDGSTYDADMTKRTVSLDPVPDDYGVEVFPLAGTTGVGYVHLRSHISTADAQLRTAFATFRQQGLQYYIVDLRYNGGGLVNTAELIDDLLGDARSTSDVQYRVIHNAARSNQNSTVRFVPQPQSVTPVRIAFLTTEGTASASELNVNAMKPWVETAIVGADTLGKPVGQLAFDLAGCQDRLRLIAFKLENADSEGDYYDGLAPTMQFACAAPDTLDAPLGSAADSLVQAALDWIGTGACGNVISAAPGGLLKPDGSRAPPFPRPREPSNAEHWLPGIQ